MTTSLIIEEDRGTYTRRARRHNGYFGGDFSAQPVLSPLDLLAQPGSSTMGHLS